MPHSPKNAFPAKYNNASFQLFNRDDVFGKLERRKKALRNF
jgi:hypothetical protein